MPIYEYQCQVCNDIFEEYAVKAHDIMNSPCPKCGGLGDRKYSLSTPKMFDSFTTTNILPHGRPVTVRSQSQLRQLETDHHVKMMDKDAVPPPTPTPVVS